MNYTIIVIAVLLIFIGMLGIIWLKTVNNYNNDEDNDNE